MICDKCKKDIHKDNPEAVYWRMLKTVKSNIDGLYVEKRMAIFCTECVGIKQ